jgi:protoporphyrinogen oxidase
MTGPVVILGGGPCGLSAAWELAARGVPVVVLERESLPGGLCATVEHQGWRFDLGGHRFLSSSPELVDRVKKLLGDSLLLAQRKSVVLLGGKTFQYPLEAQDLVQNLGLGKNLEALLQYGLSSLRRLGHPEPEDFAGWVRSRFGETLYQMFFGPYTEKLWGLPAERISSDWASQRISLLSLGDVALRLFGLRRSATRSYARGYFYPERGIGQIFHAMAEDITANGGEVRYQREVVGLDTHGNRVIAVRARGPQGEEVIPARAVLSTASLPALVSWLRPDAPLALRRDIASLRFRALRFFNILLDMPDLSPNTWMYVAEPRYFMSRIQEPKRRSPHSAPPGKTSVMIEIPCNEGDELWSMSDEELFPRVVRDLASLGFDIGGKSLGYFSTRVKEGYPVYHVGYTAPRERLLEEAMRFQNLFTAGRQGAFRYVFMDTAMEMGIQAARAIARTDLGARRKVASMGAGKGLIEAAAVTA